MTTVYLMRHSERLKEKGIVINNDSAQLTNEKNILSIVGEEKARKLSENEELQNIDVLWCSAYVRAKQTAKYIADKNNIDMNVDFNLNERKLGNIDEINKIMEDSKVDYSYTQIYKRDLKATGGESALDVMNRMNNAINRIISENKDKRIAIVSHGAALKFYLVQFCEVVDELYLKYNGKRLSFDAPCLIKMTLDDNNEIIDIKNIEL